MQLLSTLVFLAVAIQCAVAAPERNLLRSGYDRPIFSDLADLATAANNPTSQQQQANQGASTMPSSIDPINKGGLLPGVNSSPYGKKRGALPSTKSQPSEEDPTSQPEKGGVNGSSAQKTSPKGTPKPPAKKTPKPNHKKTKVDPAKSPVQRPVV
ncbi:hypothetical protein ON010_g4409 [Phytophthora cinnamomi]|nr:hypothetical protein ON010_g4409 [Phytophthora cinnamomi]